MSRSLLSLARFKSSRFYSLNNQPFRKETKTKMVVTKALTMVAAHGKQSLCNLVNLGKNKRTGSLGTSANCTNTGLQHTIQKISKCKTIPQQMIPTAPNVSTKSQWRSIWYILKEIVWTMNFLYDRIYGDKLSHCIWWNWQNLWLKCDPL